MSIDPSEPNQDVVSDPPLDPAKQSGTIDPPTVGSSGNEPMGTEGSDR